MKENLWEQVVNECLNKTCKILQTKTVLNSEEARVVKELVNTAINIDLLNLRCVEQNQGTLSSLHSSETFYKENGINQNFA